MKTILTQLAILSTLTFLGCDGASSPSKPGVGENRTPPVGDVETADLAVESPSDAPNDVVFGDKFPEVIAVEAISRENGDWNFEVTLSSTYDTPQRYADAWRVLDAEGQELGIRILGHDHANEQPFTRSGTIQIPEGVDTVFVEGRDQLHGWSGQRFEFKLHSLDELREESGETINLQDLDPVSDMWDTSDESGDWPAADDDVEWRKTDSGTIWRITGLKFKKPTTPSARPGQLQWRSPGPGYLEIASWLDDAGGFVWGLIRNPGPSPLEYNDHFLGEHYAVRLFARNEQGGEWQGLERRKFPRYEVRNGTAGLPENIHVLRPDEEVRPKTPFWPKDASLKSGYSFVVPLEHFVWPEEWSGEVEVEVMIRQSGIQLGYRRAGAKKEPLQTAPITVDLDVLRGSELLIPLVGNRCTLLPGIRWASADRAGESVLMAD